MNTLLNNNNVKTPTRHGMLLTKECDIFGKNDYTFT